MPMTGPDAFGVHPLVCCPKPLPESAICFPSDPWCRTYEAPDYSEYEYVDCGASEETADLFEEDQGEVTTQFQYDFQEFGSTGENNDAGPSQATVLLYN